MEGQEAWSEPRRAHDLWPVLLLIGLLFLHGQPAFSDGAQGGWMALQVGQGRRKALGSLGACYPPSPASS